MVWMAIRPLTALNKVIIPLFTVFTTDSMQNKVRYLEDCMPVVAADYLFVTELELQVGAEGAAYWL